jgi:hypothetical protein
MADKPRYPRFGVRVSVGNFALMDMIADAIADPAFDARAWYKMHADALERLARMIREGHEKGGTTP